jgi:AcrR family transcriptional regulator
MSELGTASMTLREVSQRAGVDPALAQYYFRSKAGLQAAVVESATAELRSRIERIACAPGTFEERARELIRAYVGALASDPAVTRMALERALFSRDEGGGSFLQDYVAPSLSAVRPLVEEGVGQGQLRPTEPLFLFSSFVGASLFFASTGADFRRLFGVDERPEDLHERFADYMTELFLHGLTPAGPKVPADSATASEDSAEQGGTEP